jgi:hypothetical protein
MKKITKKDLVEAINALVFDSDLKLSGVTRDTPLLDLDVRSGNVGTAQVLSDCGVNLRKADEEESAQLAALRQCETFGDLLDWCNDERKKA